MANIASVSQTELTSRRKKLRRARRMKSFQSLWRTMFVGGMATSLVWAITLPNWVIRSPEQIVIEGNHFLSKKAIRSLLALSYPQSILQVHPQAIAKSLETKGPIAHAVVSRQLLPPGLTIQVKERKPVAIAKGLTDRNAKASNPNTANGLIDEQGVWMPKSVYTQLEQNLELPTLRVIGDNQQYRPYWSEVYQAVSRSAVQVFEIDWQDQGNLILKTELGNVHLGPYSARFSEQLAILDRMRELPTHVSPSKIAYIDLKNPDLPAIQMTKGNDSARSTTH